MLGFNNKSSRVIAFIKARLNRDNFWNLMFWLGMTIGIECFRYFRDTDAELLGNIVLCLTLLGVPLITKLAQKVKFDKNLGLLNSNGELLKESLPMDLGVFVFCSIACIMLVDFFEYDIRIFGLYVVPDWSFFFLISTLHFIYKNCPIAILFNQQAWEAGTFITRGRDIDSMYTHHSENPYTSLNPYYKHWAGNPQKRRHND